MNSTVNLFLTGNLLPGFSAETAAPLLAKMMRVSDEKALKCLEGRKTLVKRGLATADSGKYLNALSRMGVEAEAVEVPQEVPLDISQETPVPVIVPVVQEDNHGFPSIAASFNEPAVEPESSIPLPSAPSFSIAAVDPTPAALPELSFASIATPTETKTLSMADLSVAEMPAVEEVTCPVCQTVQPKRTLCRQCGTDMPRALLAQQQNPQTKQADMAQAIPGLRQFDKVEEFTPSPFGFWPTGRIGRLRYLAFLIFAYLPVIVGGFFGGLFGGALGSMGKQPTFGILAILGLGCLISAVLMMRAAALRLHDFSFSGKWLFTPLVAFLMAITGSPVAALFTLLGFWVLSIMICFWPGDMEDNKYGSPAGENSVWVYLGSGFYALLIVISVFTTAGKAVAAYHDYQEKAYQKAHPEEGGGTMEQESTSS